MQGQADSGTALQLCHPKPVLSDPAGMISLCVHDKDNHVQYQDKKAPSAPAEDQSCVKWC